MLSKRQVIAVIVLMIPLMAVFMPISLSYPEYQAFIEKHSGRNVSCAMCHTHPNGPIGNEEGQLEKLSSEQIERLHKARATLEPGQEVDNPFLNKFGNQIIKTVGRGRLIELRANPAALASQLGDTSDLDNDGISDAQEYLGGTDPLNKYHGDPWLLFIINLKRYWIHVALAIAAIALIDYGLANLLKWLELLTNMRKGKF